MRLVSWVMISFVVLSRRLGELADHGLSWVDGDRKPARRMGDCRRYDPRMTVNRSAAGLTELARVMAHCGGSPMQALRFINGGIASAPEDPEPYAVLADLWREQREEVAELLQGANSAGAALAQSYISFLENDMDDAAMAIGGVTGARPAVAWANAPWFSDIRFLDAVSADALAEAVMRTMDVGHDLDAEDMRERLGPWFKAIDVVCVREPRPEAMAKMAIFLRACGLIDASFALCDRADSHERIMLTEVVRAGTWRKLGDPEQAAAAFERAVILDPTNWSLYLDLADLHAEQGDFTSAVHLVEQGLEHGPNEITLRAARAAYRARCTSSRRPERTHRARTAVAERLVPQPPDRLGMCRSRSAR